MHSLGCFVLAITSSIVLAPAFAEVPAQNRRPVEHDSAGNAVRDDTGEPIIIRPGHSAVAEFASAAKKSARPSVVVPLQAAPEGPYSMVLDRVWQYAVWGTSIGRSGMDAVDLDHNGSMEVVVGASLSGGFSANSHWHVLRYDDANSTYRKVFTSDFSDAGVSHIEVYEIGGINRIIVGNYDGDLQVFDSVTFELVIETNLGGGTVHDSVMADGDNDGVDELLVATDAGTYLLNPSGLAVDGQIPYTGNELAVGNVDTDSALEIVFVTGAVVQYDGTVAIAEWDFSQFAAGAYLGLTDLDGDGMDEIVAARSWYYIDVYDADLKSPKYQINSDLDIQALLLADVTGDGGDEILYGDGQWGNIYAMDATAGAELWRIVNPEHGTTRIAVADTDGDGELEVMWGAGWTSTGEDYFYIHDIATLANEFDSVDLVGPFHAAKLGSVDDDPVPEFVVASFESNSGYSDGVVHVFDSETFELEWRSDTALFNRQAWTGIHDVEIGDVDGDGETEIVVATDRLYDGGLFIVNGQTKQLERDFEYDSGSPLYALSLADFDDDGVLDIVAGGGKEHTGSPGTYIYTIDGVSGAVRWKSVSLSTGWSDTYALETFDLDGDTVPDIVATLDNLFIVDGASKILKKSIQSDYRGFAVSRSSTGEPIIWAGTLGGDLMTVDPETMSRTLVANICNSPVNSLKIDRASTLVGSLQFACNDSLGIWDIFNQQVAWRSPVLGSSVGFANNLEVTNQGDQALLIAGFSSGVAAYRGFGTANTDIDGDGIPNYLDNCPATDNPGQADADGDGIGDACNDVLDSDGDEWADQLDNCPYSANAGQDDTDGDGVGNACNDSQDSDGDEWSDVLDNCPDTDNADQTNSDGDVLGDACDPYPDNADNYAARCEEAIFNEAQLSVDLSECQAIPKMVDDDGDGEANSTDACPNTFAGLPVDDAGCSNMQFCRQFSGDSYKARRTCVMSDWGNDEPTNMEPGDCMTMRDNKKWYSASYSCVAPRPPLTFPLPMPLPVQSKQLTDTGNKGT